MKIKNLIKHPLFAGSAVMIIGSNIANFFAYIYHLIIGRMLGPSGYGELASIISLIGLFSVTFGFMGLVVMKFVSGSRKSDIPTFFSWIERRTLVAASIVGLILLFSTSLLAKFLNSSTLLTFLVGPTLFVYFVGFIYRSFLQGLLKFGKVVITSNIDLFGRLVLGVVLVSFGFGVFGGVLGVFTSAFISLLLTIYFLKKYIKKKNGAKPFQDGKKVWAYSMPILLMSISTNSMYMSDVILVKHFLDPHMSGIYASLSNLGKIIFFGAAPISSVMFPIISKKFTKGENTTKVFLLSLFLTIGLSLGILGVYYLFPQFVVNLLYGESFIEGSEYLAWFGLFMTIFTINGLILNYFLSKNITKPVYLSLVASIFQLILIWFFHTSILEVVSVSLIISLVLFGSLLIYLGYEANLNRNTSLQSRKNNR